MRLYSDLIEDITTSEKWMCQSEENLVNQKNHRRKDKGE